MGRINVLLPLSDAAQAQGCGPRHCSPNPLDAFDWGGGHIAESLNAELPESDARKLLFWKGLRCAVPVGGEQGGTHPPSKAAGRKGVRPTWLPLEKMEGVRGRVAHG